MKRFLIGAVAAVLITLPAHAADLARLPVKAPLPPPVSVYNWSGFYAHGFGDYNANVAGSTTTLFTNTTVDVGSIPHGAGFGGGVDALYQGAGSAWVFGARAEIGWMNLDATGNLTTAGVNLFSLNSATNYLGDVDAKLGYALSPDGRLLGYVVGGLAFGGEHSAANLTNAAGCLTGVNAASCSSTISSTSVGWNIGAGLDFAVPNTPITLFIEGDYYDIGSKALSIVPIGGGTPILTSTVRDQIFQQKLGASIKLVGPQ